LLDTALGPPPPFPESHFGDYELVQELAQGGMGVVYLARQKSLDRQVALKMLTRGVLASDAEMRRIHDEAKIAARLKHPNIVPIYEVGVHEEIAYYTMPLMEGGSLAEQMPHLHGRFREAALLLEMIARAVHHGHQRGILHRDLKPANVLLDAAGVPYVADFGLAKALDSEARVTQTGPVEGTLSYMALEQAEPEGLPLTVAADVYSLGVILYELLTGRLPFEAESFDTLLTRLREGRPLAPRAIHSRVPRSLEAICLKCLDKEPARRYGSAAELADDLRRFLEKKPVLAMPAGPLKRAWLWCLTNPLRVGLLATLLWALSVAAVGTFQTVREQEKALRDAALRMNVFAAQRIADGVHLKLRNLGRSVEHMATQKEFVAALQARDPVALESFCKQVAENNGVVFERVFVKDAQGLALARWPEPKKGAREFLLKEYDWRDYFKGAQRQAPGGPPTAYISRAFQSESDDRITFALSVPVYSENGTWLGVLSATVASDNSLGSLQLNEPGAPNHTVTLVSLVDRNRGETQLPPASQYAVILHDRIDRGILHRLKNEFGEHLALALSKPPSPEQPEQGHSQHPSFGGRVIHGYRDPVSNEPGLAAFAPVKDTTFVAIMQTREQAALAPSALLADRIAWWSRPLVLGIGLVWLVFWAARSWSLRHRGL
jgi:serine/threonine-protein kinase